MTSRAVTRDSRETGAGAVAAEERRTTRHQAFLANREAEVREAEDRSRRDELDHVALEVASARRRMLGTPAVIVLS